MVHLLQIDFASVTCPEYLFIVTLYLTVWYKQENYCMKAFGIHTHGNFDKFENMLWFRSPISTAIVKVYYFPDFYRESNQHSLEDFLTNYMYLDIIRSKWFINQHQ